MPEHFATITMLAGDGDPMSEPVRVPILFEQLTIRTGSVDFVPTRGAEWTHVLVDWPEGNIAGWHAPLAWSPVHVSAPPTMPVTLSPVTLFATS